MNAWKIDDAVRGVRLGLVHASPLTIGESSEALRDWCQSQIVGLPQQGMAGGEPRREAVRAMLRAGGFKPAGRNKPAQEYLFRTLSESGSLPAILNAVDVLNVISLRSGLPISLLSAEAVGSQPIVRYGQAGETFLFNRSGQDLDVTGLLCVCHDDNGVSVPIGTPVKDSMTGKVNAASTDIWSVLYAPVAAVSDEELAGWCARLAEAYQRWCVATATVVRTVESSM